LESCRVERGQSQESEAHLQLEVGRRKSPKSCSERGGGARTKNLQTGGGTGGREGPNIHTVTQKSAFSAKTNDRLFGAKMGKTRIRGKAAGRKGSFIVKEVGDKVPGAMFHEKVSLGTGSKRAMEETPRKEKGEERGNS